MQQDYSDYRISDLIRDLGDDASAVRSKLRFVNKLRQNFALLTTVWGYVSVALFVAFGVTHLLQTGELVLPILAFSVSGVYFIVNTALLIADKRRSPARRNFNRVFRIVGVILKLAMTGVMIYSLAAGDAVTAGFRIAWCLLSVLWLGVTVAGDVAYFLIERALRMLKDLAVDRLTRTKSAITNTANDFVEIARTVKGIGSEIKHLFVGKKNDDSDDHPRK